MKKFSLVLIAFMLILCSGFTAVSNAEGQETLADVLGKSSSGDEKTKVLLDYENYSFIGDAEKQGDTKEIFKSLKENIDDVLYFREYGVTSEYVDKLNEYTGIDEVPTFWFSDGNGKFYWGYVDYREEKPLAVLSEVEPEKYVAPLFKHSSVITTKDGRNLTVTRAEYFSTFDPYFSVKAVACETSEGKYVLWVDTYDKDHTVNVNTVEEFREIAKEEQRKVTEKEREKQKKELEEIMPKIIAIWVAVFVVAAGVLLTVVLVTKKKRKESVTEASEE